MSGIHNPPQVTLNMDAGGWYIEWYRDDDNNSGFGDNAQVVRWYAGRVDDPRAGCEARAREDAPEDGWVDAVAEERLNYSR